MELDLTRFGIAEEDGQIIGVVHSESNPAEVICQVRPGYEHIRFDLLNYAEEIDYRGNVPLAQQALPGGLCIRS